jgi:monoamine oxidase
MRNQCCLVAIRNLLGACLLMAATVNAEHAVQEKVVVIGAGLAGLNTALLLEENGFDVTVLEARQRIGGRLYTLDEVPGRPEAGGNTIGPSYARVIDRAASLGVKLVKAPEVIGGFRTMQLYVDGQFIPVKDWAASPANPFPDQLKRIPPGGMINGVIRDNPLKEASDWLQPYAAQYDVAVSSVFDQLGFNECAQDLLSHNGSAGLTLASSSLLQVYKSQLSFLKARHIKGYSMAVEGGNQRLPEAMAKVLKKKVRTGEVVTHIKQSNDSVMLQTAAGNSYQADYVVSTVPLTALRDINIEPELPAIQQQAINEIDYSKTLIAQLTVAGNYWGKNSPSLWTDTAIGRIFSTSLDGSGEVSNVTLWLTGNDALHFSAMKADLRDKALLEAFYGIYPDAKGKVTLHKVVDWNNDPFAKGTWPAYKPGQISTLLPQLSKPAGRLYFAGEHTAITNPGMEGAMESSERVVAEILRGRANAEQLFMACKACHSTEPGQVHKVGPNLAGFFGQPAASRAGYNYSPALSSSGLRWDKETLKQWLSAPEQLVAGNKMIYRSYLNDTELDVLVDFLATELKGESKEAQ